jgi:signal peptide peptidase SppA
MSNGSFFSRLLPGRRRRHPTVAVVRCFGIIGGGGRARLNIANLAGPIERAFRIRGVKAVALDINSPGGSPVQSSLIYRRIRALAAEKKIPVFAFAQDVAASGGYWLACAGDEIYADENSILGSIGVISGGFGLQDFIGRFGIERRMHTSGESKSFLDPFLPEKEDEVARLKALQGDIHDSFKALVRDRRQGKLKGGEAGLFSGEFWTGRRALDLGLIDGLGDLRGIMRERFGDKVRFRVFGAESGWLRRRLGIAWPEPPGLMPWAEDLIGAVEARALWHRYGL